MLLYRYKVALGTKVTIEIKLSLNIDYDNRDNFGSDL